MRDNLLVYAKKILLTLSIVFAFISIIIFLAGASPLKTFLCIINNCMTSSIQLEKVMQIWIPLTLCCFGLLYTFRINLWNIGIEGQFIIGAVVTTIILKLASGFYSNSTLLFFCFIASFSGGAIWALMAILLKNKGGIHEIFAGLAFNFIASIIIFLMLKQLKGFENISSNIYIPFAPELLFPNFAMIKISIIGLYFVFGTFIITIFILLFTKFGLNLKAIGNNELSAFMFGLDKNKYMSFAMIFAGGLAGLAGNFQATSSYSCLEASILCNYGYMAILVVMLANYNVLLTPFLSLFFAFLKVGSTQLETMMHLDSSLSGIIQGALVFSFLIMRSWRIKHKGKI